MTFYDDPKNVEGYIAMCEKFDAAKELPPLITTLPNGARLLEIGSGPGNDLALLAQHYDVTGSDSSDMFIQHLKSRFPETPILNLDAQFLKVDSKFDAIYSNKVLHHLDDTALQQSFQAQLALLSENGLVYHLIWRVIDEMPDMGGLDFIARSEVEMENLMGPHFKILNTMRFAEFTKDDSIAILARKSLANGS